MSSNQVCSFQFVSSDSASSIYILFTGVIDLQQTKIDRLELIAVGQPENISPIRLSVSTYKDVVNLCQKLKYEGKQLKNLTNKLTELFQANGKSDDFMEQIMHYMKSKDKEKISYLLNQVINQAAGNSKPEIQIHYTILDRARLDEESQSFSASNSSTSTSEESSRFDDEDLPSLESSSEPYRSTEPVDHFIPAGARIIPMKYVLSPVSGVQINTLKPGDKIMIQLLKADASSQSIIESMKLETPEGQIRPVPGTVVTSKNNGVENETLIQIGSDIFGKIYEEENSIKVKPYTGEKPIQTSAAVKPSAKSSSSSEDSGLLITILIAFGILGIAMTAIFVFLL
ncbi:hypothetical protein CH379_011005 [Leptospira ellisii]|uniref:Uncharacterized protein n=1 Tax=Leptospira ellisii TaxID=2023197 RepID=A0A2N0BNF5_9LEPT|nr:hypothetical protein [Leptospira ellisii]MDV6236150.1 hypothetical protein [Leptospira ellisii]PJZ94688.1 hypothetical protein CH379_01375 [Leptospira ellisii]PKA05503.1 hypothetical protein CH375_04780 [Leptospira ellisii]